MTSSNKIQFKEWARYADEDLEIAELAIREGGPPNQICFHTQQAAEKYLKGFLVFKGKEFEKSHLLRYLLDLCVILDSSFRDLEEDVIFLTQFYIETRYPGDIPTFNVQQAKEAFWAATRIKEFIKDRVKF